MAALDVMVEDILDAVTAAIEAAAGQAGSGLEEVQAVVRGDSARPMPKLPAVWVVPQPAQYEQIDFGDAEQWTLDISIAALVKHDNPETGARTAQRLAARARKAALSIRGSLPGLVDVTSRTYDPSARRSEQNRNLHWTDATIRTTFTVEE